MPRAAASAALVALAAAGAGGCAPEEDAGRCEVTTRRWALTAAERKVVGEAAPYPADGALRAREAELAASQRARREAAWAAIARVLAPVPLAEDLPAHDGPETLPRWHTWYGRDDVRRIFQKVWRALPADVRRARAPLRDDDLDAAFAWNPRAVEDLDTWPEERWRAYVASLDEADEVAGVGGIGRVGYAPGAARHAIASYAEAIDCRAAGAPPAVADGPADGREVVRAPLALAACEERWAGPYFVAGGERLIARAPAAVRVHAGVPDGPVACAADAGAPCEVAGPAALWVVAASGTAPVDGVLEIEHVAPDAPWAACLAGRMPGDAAIVKAEWQRAELGFRVPVFDTSAAALARRVDGDAAWGDGDGEADPGDDAIYTVRTASGQRYRLVALHVMTRELDHWLWATLWWSPEPDADFGADRPPAIAALGGPWRHYKMCAATAFAEGDPDPTGGAADPGLAAALAAVHAGAGGPTWCSNPYLERGHGNAATNCLGCHQHGGAGLSPEAILADPAGFPAHGRLQVRNNFPSDYLWAMERGDDLGGLFRDEVLYWDDVE